MIRPKEIIFQKKWGPEIKRMDDDPNWFRKKAPGQVIDRGQFGLMS
jgi:hypothetical protein